MLTSATYVSQPISAKNGSNLENFFMISDLSPIFQCHVSPQDVQSKKIPKFSQDIDLDGLSIPYTYKHPRRLADFKHEYLSLFGQYDPKINDAHCQDTIHHLVPIAEINHLRVRAFRESFLKSTRHEDKVEFLNSECALYLGPQGLSLIFEYILSHKKHPAPVRRYAMLSSRRSSVPGKVNYVPCIVVKHGMKPDFCLIPDYALFDEVDVFLCVTYC